MGGTTPASVWHRLLSFQVLLDPGNAIRSASKPPMPLRTPPAWLPRAVLLMMVLPLVAGARPIPSRRCSTRCFPRSWCRRHHSPARSRRRGTPREGSRAVGGCDVASDRVARRLVDEDSPVRVVAHGVPVEDTSWVRARALDPEQPEAVEVAAHTAGRQIRARFSQDEDAVAGWSRAVDRVARGPAMVSSLTCALLPSTTTPLSKPVIVPGPFRVIRSARGQR